MQRANPTPAELADIETIVEEYRGATKRVFKVFVRRFPADLRVYGRIVLEHTHAEGIILTEEEWEHLCVDE